jgi:hypothetical protein
MNITLKIDNNGQANGTLGWLCKTAASIKIGNTKTGKQAAWLMGHDGKSIACLAVRGYWGDVMPPSDIQGMTRNMPECLGIDFGVTDAAWAKLEEIRDLAIEMMNEDESLAQTVEVCVAVAK